MELLLVVTTEGGAPVEMRVEADPAAPGAEIVSALARAVGAAEPITAWVSRTAAPIALQAPLRDAQLCHGDQVHLAAPGRPSNDLAAGSPDQPASYVLAVVGGPRAGQRFPLRAGSGYLLGRDDSADINLGDAQASRRHLHLGVGSKEVVASDAGSTNGTFLDGRRLTEPTTLRLGQVIEVGTKDLGNLMNKCSRHPRAAGKTSHQRSTPPGPPAGARSDLGLEVQVRGVLTHQRLPDPILPHGRPRQLSLGQQGWPAAP